MRASFKHIVRKDIYLRNLFHFLLRSLAAGLVLYGRYTCGIYCNDADGWDDECYYLLYGERQVDGTDTGKNTPGWPSPVL